MINQFRIDRDFAVQIIWDWNIHVKNYNSLLKDLEKIEKNRQSNRNIVNILKRENRIVEKFNTQIFKLKENNQILQDQVNTLRMNSAITFISQNDNKLKIDNVKLIIRNIELQNEINYLKNKISSINFELLIDKKNKSVKMTNSLKFSESTSNLSYEIWEQLVKNKLIVNVSRWFRISQKKYHDRYIFKNDSRTQKEHYWNHCYENSSLIYERSNIYFLRTNYTQFTSLSFRLFHWQLFHEFLSRQSFFDFQRWYLWHRTRQCIWYIIKIERNNCYNEITIEFKTMNTSNCERINQLFRLKKFRTKSRNLICYYCIHFTNRRENITQNSIHDCYFFSKCFL